MRVASASASLLLLLSARLWTRNTKTFFLFQIRGQLQHHDHVIAVPSKRTVRREDCLFIGCVSHLQREQPVWLPVIIRHSVSTTPQSLMLFFFDFFFFSPWLALTNHRKSSTGNNLECSQAHVNVMAPLRSFFTHHVSQEICASPHDALHSLFHGADSQDHGRLSRRAQIQALSWGKLVHTCWTPWSVLQQSMGAVGASTGADACAFASQPHPPVLSHGHEKPPQQ